MIKREHKPRERKMKKHDSSVGLKQPTINDLGSKSRYCITKFKVIRLKRRRL